MKKETRLLLNRAYDAILLSIELGEERGRSCPACG